MIIEAPRTKAGQLGPAIASRILLDSQSSELPGELYFECHSGSEEHLSRLSDPFLIGMLPIAMKLGEDITVAGPVSVALAYGIDSYQDVVTTWFPGACRRVRIHYDQLVDRVAEPRSPGVASCFSGGLDSFYSVYQHLPDRQPIEAFQLTHGLIINGFDYLEDFEHDGTIRRMFDTYGPIMESWGLKLLVIESNLKVFRNIVFARHGKAATWGSIIIANAHALGNLFGRFLIPAGAGYTWEELIPHGSHALLDPLLSSDHLQIAYSGGKASRAQKVEKLANVPEVQNGLRVCFGVPRFDEQTGKPFNCCECEKCVRTIAALDIVGKLDCFPSFQNHRPIDDYKNPKILARSHELWQIDNYRLAKRWQRTDWAKLYAAANKLTKQKK